MPIILSLSQNQTHLWAAGPDGLYRLNQTQQPAEWQPVSQPQTHLYCCLVVEERILVGGTPHGVAYRPITDPLNDSFSWQAAYLDGASGPIDCLAPAPDIAESGVMLAGTQGSGLLRSTDCGRSWLSCNFGLQDETVLTLAWAPIPPHNQWPRWETVFAGTEEGVYRSPNGGRGWQRCTAPTGIVQSLAVSPNFHENGQVLAGTEAHGLWRSTDGGRSFTLVSQAPQQINALIAAPSGWLLSDETHLWHSTDGLAWHPVPNSPAALTLLATPQTIWAGTQQGVCPVNLLLDRIPRDRISP